MCGIAGRYHGDRLPEDREWGERASRLLRHRGPDGAGFYRDPNCELVHRRLAILDLSPNGNQPMPNEDESVQVVFSGEIYNHRELRREVEALGHRFRSRTDTEVLVHLYEEQGTAFLPRLEGMFAFAIYDRRRRRLVLARDRFGIKPLYYAEAHNQWIFGSEIKAILALDGFAPTLDRQAIYDFLGLGYVAEPATGYANISALPKGSALVVDGTEARLSRFATLQARPCPGRSFEETVASAGDSLERAVRAQSVADVPVAALLSGGIDSSLLVATYGRVASEPPWTFNVRFPDNDFDETQLAVAVSGHCGTRHRTIDLDGRALDPALVEDLLLHFDQPFADSSLIPTYFVAQAIRDQGIVCALSGDGGDEAFGGYARFWRAETLVRLMSVPRPIQYLLGVAGEAMTPWTRDRGRQLAKAVRLAQAGAARPAELVAGLSSYLSEPQKEQLVAHDARQGLLPLERLFDQRDGSERGNDLESLSRLMTESLFEVSLPSDMLRKVDMMSMRASVEVRVPLLSEPMVELGLGLCHRFKTDGRCGKLVLRELARRWLPESVATHPKHGFAIPLDVMATASFYEMLADRLLGNGSRISAFISTERVGEWLGAFHRAGGGQHGGAISRGGVYQRLFILLALELWLGSARLTW